MGTTKKWGGNYPWELRVNRLHDVLKQADVVHPWLVGRYSEESYEAYRRKNIIDDVKWCKEHGKSYAPTVFPGFSWYNMKPNEVSNKIPRNKGKFYWKQITGAIDSGAEMLYVAMFDEIDEGTAVFKCTNDPPVGKLKFIGYEGMPEDHYLKLTGAAGQMLRGEIPFTKKVENLFTN